MSDARAIAHRLAARLSSERDEPIATLIVDDIWMAVVEGTLGTGERLPTGRELAVALGVSPRTVERAYQELEARGVVATRPGEGTFISLHPPPEAERERHRAFADLCRETYERAADLGFTVDEVVDAMVEFRSLERVDPEKEGRP